MNLVNSKVLSTGERIPKRFVYTKYGAELFDKNIFSQKSGIYMLTNAFDGKRYIGQSSNLYQRICGHASSYKNVKSTQRIVKAIRKYGFDSFTISILDYCEKEKLDEKEIYWISILSPEYNIAIGGKTNKGYHCSEETKKILSIKSKLQWANKSEEEKALFKSKCKGPKIGHIVTESTRAKLRAINLGKKMSEETKRKISISNKGKNDNKSHYKKVGAFDDNGELIREFSSILEAANTLNVNDSCISGVLRGRRKHCRGYIWKYL